MKFLSLDLEMLPPSMKIIQVGACIGDLATGEIVETLRAYVKIDEPLSEFITSLTGITDARLHEEGTSLLDAYNKLLEMANRYKDRFPAILQWGSGDAYTLKKQLLERPILTDGNAELVWPFGRGGELDAKKLFQTYQISRGASYRSGLSKSMNRLGLQFKGRKHDGLDDAINTFTIFHHLVGKFKP
jgi:inhibitor of KinA sporulation pathway (predicted exonuclease)